MRVLAPQATQKVQLDAYDKKILFALSQDYRTPYNQIAKQAGLSRDAVRYRIERLKTAGVLQGSRTIIDITRLGYLNVHLLLQLNQPTKTAEEHLVKTFTQYPFVRAIIKFSGKYDFELALVCKDFNQLESIISQVISDCGEYLQDHTILFVTKSYLGKTFPDNFLKGAQETKPVVLETPSLDENDYALLRVLADDADLPLYEIGNRIGVSADTVKYRMKRLKDSGVIRGFVPVVNYDLINYNVYAILLSIGSLDKRRESILQEFLRTNKSMLWAVKTVGKYNVMLYVATTNPDELITTTNELRGHFTQAIKDYETLINYEEYKYTYLPETVKG